MSSWSRSVSMIACGLILSMSNECSAAERSTELNVILIVSDYMGYRDIEPYGATDIRTPSLSRLAEEGVRMTDFYAAAPVCGPSRASLYTGQYPARIGFEQNIRSESDGLSASVASLPRWLKDSGYRTAIFGKWHLGYAPEFTPNAHGFDQFVGHHQWTVDYYRHQTEQGDPGLYENDHLTSRDGYLTDVLTNEAIEFIDANASDPFFVTLAYNAALPPYQPPGLPESQWDDGWDVNQASRSDYVKMVERMDEGIGRVLEALDERDLTDNTLVIYLYDHGGRHLVDSTPLFHGFANLWEGGIRIPVIMRLPGVIPDNSDSAIPAIAMDLTATILHVTGLGEVAESLDGMNLIPFLDEQNALRDRQLFWRANHYQFGRQRAIREGRWKYLEDDSTQFLFDIDADEAERNNLYSEHTDVANRLRADLDAWESRMPLQD